VAAWGAVGTELANVGDVEDALDAAGRAALVYLFVVFLIRLAGKRTVATMNNFDWLLTVAMGAMMGTTILSPDLPLVAGLAAIGVLVGMQVGLTWLTTHSEVVAKAVRSTPRVLVEAGRVREDAARRERVRRDELRAEVRKAAGIPLEEVDWATLEEDGQVSLHRASADPCADDPARTAQNH
jgi:uncharacterized membrane protein YcaP (DUF421 family)